MQYWNLADCDLLFAAFAELLDNALDEVIEHIFSVSFSFLQKFKEYGSAS